MNLNNAIAPRTQPASIKRRSGWRFALGFKVAAFSALSMFGMLGINQIALAASEKLPEKSYTMAPAAPERQTAQQAFAKTEGCMSCHTQTDEHTMHANPGVVLGCTDCHGGDATVKWNGPEQKQGSLAYDHTRAAREKGFAPEYRDALDKAHIAPRNEKFWNYPSSANPKRSYAKLNKEHPAYIRFINPGDLRVAREACGACHLPIIQAQERSLMSTSAMLWGGASYNLVC